MTPSAAKAARLLRIPDSGNAKIGEGYHTFSLPAGWSCPFADRCLSKADRNTGKITDGKNLDHRCFAATMEARYPSVRNTRWHNFELLLAARAMGGMVEPSDSLVELIAESVAFAAPINGIRVHVSGDFFHKEYMRAWFRVARFYPRSKFWAYTKSIRWVRELKEEGELPPNWNMTLSYGGKQDDLIADSGIKAAHVVFYEEEARKLGLPIDHDDSLARDGDQSFALLVHGQQPAGSKASRAMSDNKAGGVRFSYPGKEKSTERAEALAEVSA